MPCLMQVLGSADVLGNPIHFVRTLGSGMWDFVSTPARSFKQVGFPCIHTFDLVEPSCNINKNIIFSISIPKWSSLTLIFILQYNHGDFTGKLCLVSSCFHFCCYMQTDELELGISCLLWGVDTHNLVLVSES